MHPLTVLVSIHVDPHPDPTSDGDRFLLLRLSSRRAANYWISVRAPLHAREINARGFECPGGFSPVHATLSPAGRKSPTTVWEPRGLKSHPTKKILRTQEKTKNSKMQL